MKKKGMVFFGSMAVGMIALVIWSSTQSDLFNLPKPVLEEPWFWTTLVDFYNNIAIISLWVIYKENSWLRSLLWIIAFILGGSITTAAYLVIQLLKLKKDEGIEALLLRRS